MRLSKRKRMLIIGIISGLCCAICVTLYLGDVEAQANEVQQEMLARYGGEQVEVCVARRNIASGETISESDIETRTWIASMLPPDPVISKSDAVGKQIGSTILKGEVISSSRFGIESQDLDVPDGMVAVSVPAEDVRALGGNISKGMKCDLYAVGASSTTCLARSVQVIATSNTDQASMKSSSSWITLAINPSKVAEIVSAADSLELYFTLPSTTLEDSSDDIGHRSLASDQINDEKAAKASPKEEEAAIEKQANGGAQ